MARVRIINPCQSALQAACVPVYLHVGSEVQTQRLLQRGRENSAEVAERVARSQVLKGLA